MSKFEIQMRLNVQDPPAGVTMKMQKGRCELLDPMRATKKMLTFDFPISVDLSSGTPNFLGKFAQGPKDARFVYLNSGTYAGEKDSPWGRRAKISLMSVTAKQVRELLKTPGSILSVSFAGTSQRDTGPVCASVRFLGDGWQIIKK
jgi:hypothetical protein